MGLQRRASGELLMTASGALADECCCNPVSPAECTWQVSPSSLIFDCQAQNGGFTVNVPSGAGCGWSASVTSGGSFLSINSGGSGSVSGLVGITIAANAGVDRTGQITVVTTISSDLGPIGTVIGIFNLTQNECGGGSGGAGGALAPGATCTWSISPGSGTYDCFAQSGSFNVNTNTGCGWAASVISGGSFISIISGSSGVDSGTLIFDISKNTSSPRGGQIEVMTTVSSGFGPIGTVIGVYNIGQSQCGSGPGGGGIGLAPCNWNVDQTPVFVTDPCAVHSDSREVTAPAGCSWNAVANEAWITITGGSSGLSSGTIQFDVAANNTSSVRNGTITVTTGSGSAFGPAGTLIGTISFTEHSCNTFIVSQVDGPPIRLFTGGGCFPLTDSAAAPVWDNTVTFVGPAWESAGFATGMGKNYVLGGPYPASNGGVNITPNVPVAGTYSLQFFAQPSGFFIIYRKAGGTTPAGLYTDFVGSSNCAPPNPLSFLVTPA